MKGKMKGVFGIALVVMLLASLTVGLAAAPAGAASSNLKFTTLELPKVGPDGDYWASPGSDVGPIARTPDGNILFAGLYDGTDWQVVKSTDGGYSWTATDYYDDVVDDTTGYNDTTDIVDIVTSPEYADDTTLAVATKDFVYISQEGGKDFVQLDNPWTTKTINDLDMTIAEDGDQALIVATDKPEVYVTSGLLAWTAQDILVSLPNTDNVLACAFLPTFAADDDIGFSAVVTADTTVTGEAVGTGVQKTEFTLDHSPVVADSETIKVDGVGKTEGTDYNLVDATGVITFLITPGDGLAITADYETVYASTTMTFSFEDIADGGGWGTTGIVNAPVTNAEGHPFGSEWARIAFPDDFDAFGIGNNVCFAGIVEAGALGVTTLGSDDGSDAYRVICKEAGTSTAVDLDVRGVITTLLPTATAITSVDVCGDAEAASILVGTDAINLGDTPAYFSAYMSEDSGDTWAPSMKCPTGGTGAAIEFSDVMTRVLMAPDFCDDGLAYASTKGAGTSAFQRTTDGAESWNQISIIDYGDGTTGYAITATGFSAFGYNAEDTLYMITQVSGDFGALWGRIDGSHWERILSYANPGVTDQLSQLNILGDGSAMFATDLNVGEIWRSSDMGATWPKKISAKTPLTTVTPVSLTTIFTGSVGEIWWTERSGTGWEKPDDSEIPGGAAVIVISVAGGLVIISTDAGNGFISSDGGETVEKIGSDNPFAGGPTVVLADLGFDANGILYAVSPGSADVMRCEVDLNDPGDAEWVQIDNNQGTTVEYDETLFIAGGPPLSLPPSGILYIVDAAPVNTDTDPDFYAGGLWRSTNPTADTDSVVPPYFERENKGLDDGDALGFLNLDMDSNLAPTFFCQNPAAANYWDQVVMFTDILNVGVPLASPAADETGVGLLPEDEVYPKVNLLWEEMAGATSYQYQVAIDADFKTKVAVGFTDSLATPTMDLQPNTTYYWRARVADEGSLIGAPLISPWSEVRKFKTAIGASMARPDLQAPWPGEPDVPLSPTFEWSGIEWAEVYEYELAIDPMTTAGGYFSEPLVALVGTSSLVSTAWKCDIALDYETRYYWHVKAIGVDTDTPWSDVGTFTTMGVPPEIPPPSDGITIPPVQQITPAWIWAIVIIGAILVIAVVVLIVTTRRVP